MYIYIYVSCSIWTEFLSWIPVDLRLIAATVSFFTKPEKSHAPKAPKGASQVRMGFPGFVLDTSLMIIRTIKVTCCNFLNPIFVYPLHFFCNVTELPPPKKKKTPKKPTTLGSIGFLPGIHRWQKGICHGQEVLLYGEQGLKGLDLQPQQRANIMQNWWEGS